GTIVTAADTYKGDVLVDGEKIAMIGKGLKAAGAKRIDATGKYVIPGGIDVHTHMELPFGGTFASDDFETGTRAAAFGGTTTIVKGLSRTAENGGLICMHAENGGVIDVLVKRALAAKNTAPKWHALTRPPEAEGEATYRAFRLAEMAGGVPLYIVHLSAAQALEQVRLFRDRGLPAYAETCP